MSSRPTMDPKAAAALLAAHGGASPRMSVRAASAALRDYLSASGLRPDRWGNYPLGESQRWHFTAQSLQLQEKIDGSWRNTSSSPIIDAALAALAEAAQAAGDESAARAAAGAADGRREARRGREEKAASAARKARARDEAYRRLAELHPWEALRGFGLGPRLPESRAAELQAELLALGEAAAAGRPLREAPPVSVDSPPTLPLVRASDYSWVESLGPARFTVTVRHVERGRAAVEVGASGVSVNAATRSWRPSSEPGRVGDAYLSGSVEVGDDGDAAAALFLVVSHRAMAGAQAMSLWCRLMRGYRVRRWLGEGLNEQGDALLRGLERLGHLRVVSRSGSSAVVECPGPERRDNPGASRQKATLADVAETLGSGRAVSLKQAAQAMGTSRRAAEEFLSSLQRSRLLRYAPFGDEPMWELRRGSDPKGVVEAMRSGELPPPRPFLADGAGFRMPDRPAHAAAVRWSRGGDLRVSHESGARVEAVSGTASAIADYLDEQPNYGLADLLRELGRQRVGYIETVAVPPAARGRGVGRSVLSTALWAMRERGLSAAYLHAMPILVWDNDGGVSDSALHDFYRDSGMKFLDCCDEDNKPVYWIDLSAASG